MAGQVHKNDRKNCVVFIWEKILIMSPNAVLLFVKRIYWSIVELASVEYLVMLTGLLANQITE